MTKQAWTDLNDPSQYWRDKQRRTEYYLKYIHGWKLIPCMACNGSGYYDNTNRRGNTPKCGSCDGTGKERVSPEAYIRYREMEIRLQSGGF